MAHEPLSLHLNSEEPEPPRGKWGTAMKVFIFIVVLAAVAALSYLATAFSK